MNMMSKVRIVKELDLLKSNPPWGISCSYISSDNLQLLEAKMVGPKNTPYEDGIFTIDIKLSDKYPFEPPEVKFKTPIYHPNIDSGGNICLDLLKVGNRGGWLPTVTLENLLLSIQLLLSNPNPDDPLMIDIANEYKYNKDMFLKNARECTKKVLLPQI